LLATLKFITGHPLNRGRRRHALGTFLAWQARSRLASGPVVFDWVNGSRVLVRSGETGLTGNIYCGLHEFEDMAYLLHVLRDEDLFVDVGANVGAYTVLACAARRARGCCFEPVPSTYERLCENLTLNQLEDRVEAHNLGAGAQDGELVFTSGENCTNHVVADGEQAPEAVRVNVVALDAALGGRSPALVKIDVEGFETPVLAGASRILGDPTLHSVIMELNGSGARYGFSEDAILQTMAGFGFVTCHYEPFSRTLERRAGRLSTSGNTLFVRHLDLVRERIRTAPPVTVAGLSL
jgi:FkbM family methyltransferase